MGKERVERYERMLQELAKLALEGNEKAKVAIDYCKIPYGVSVALYCKSTKQFMNKAEKWHEAKYGIR